VGEFARLAVVGNGRGEGGGDEKREGEECLAHACLGYPSVRDVLGYRAMNRFAAYFFRYWFPTPQAVGRN
jgi:hypothetical protein